MWSRGDSPTRRAQICLHKTVTQTWAEHNNNNNNSNSNNNNNKYCSVKLEA